MPFQRSNDTAFTKKLQCCVDNDNDNMSITIYLQISKIQNAKHKYTEKSTDQYTSILSLIVSMVKEAKKRSLWAPVDKQQSESFFS